MRGRGLRKRPENGGVDHEYWLQKSIKNRPGASRAAWRPPGPSREAFWSDSSSIFVEFHEKVIISSAGAHFGGSGAVSGDPRIDPQNPSTPRGIASKTLRFEYTPKKGRIWIDFKRLSP